MCVETLKRFTGRERAREEREREIRAKVEGEKVKKNNTAQRGETFFERVGKALLFLPLRPFSSQNLIHPS
jgi:hypothetical protein